MTGELQISAPSSQTKHVELVDHNCCNLAAGIDFDYCNKVVVEAEICNFSHITTEEVGYLLHISLHQKIRTLHTVAWGV